MERMLEATADAEDRTSGSAGCGRTRGSCSIGRSRRARRIDHRLRRRHGTQSRLAETFGPAVGVERSPTGLRIASEHRRRIIAGSVTHLPFPSAVARVVTSFDVLYCLDDIAEQQAVREMFRVLSPGGVAIVNVAALEMLHGSHSTLTHEQRRYNTDRLRGLLEQAGFRIERLTYMNMMTLPLVLAVRLGERLTGKAGTASDADLRMPAAPVNDTLCGVAGVRARLAARRKPADWQFSAGGSEKTG